jgi:hypothetical protein
MSYDSVCGLNSDWHRLRVCTTWPAISSIIMSVGSAVPDIPIIDVNTGEETTLKAIIDNGERPWPSVWSRVGSDCGVVMNSPTCTAHAPRLPRLGLCSLPVLPACVLHSFCQCGLPSGWLAGWLAGVGGRAGGSSLSVRLSLCVYGIAMCIPRSQPRSLPDRR